ncbi:hypothetical protein ACH4PU_31085 [Streptomyces sp. NPDC021100]|uniref:hypothetical protein n=1 Tax=Streptomyces sp. NPDC021100 TaxID=3365114 RepID=UPI003798BFDD
MTREIIPVATPVPRDADATAVVNAHAAPRVRIVDEHMFHGTEHGPDGTFRLQLFTAPGARPVAVAVQVPTEGPSLVNLAEIYAAAAWRRYCPDESEPPIWVQMLLDDVDDRTKCFELVQFETNGRYHLADPLWCDLSDAQLTQLVGQVVDGTRGDGYVPPPAEPIAVPLYEVKHVTDLPLPVPFREPGCMPSNGRPPKDASPSAPTDCCWYHQQNWHAVCEQAIRLVEDAQRHAVTGCGILPYALDQARREGTSPNDAHALYTLLSPHLAITAGTGYTNGQHRVQAMRDLKVERTVTVRWHFADSTG